MKGKELAGTRPTMTCEVALMLGKGKSQGSICPSHDLVRTLGNFPDK
jgi:hypothetical protein